MERLINYLPENSQPATPPLKNSQPGTNEDFTEANIPQRPTEDDIIENQERRKRNGYAPNPWCTVCHGHGFLHPRLPNGKPDYSKQILCDAENCMADAKQHYRESGLYLELKGISTRMQTFDQFVPLIGTEKCLTAFRSLGYGSTDKPLLLCYGGTGNGKTHLMQALTKELNHRGINAYYYRVPDLLKTLRLSIQTNGLDEWLKSLASVGGLMLDDYGLELQTDWALSCIEDIIDARWQEKRITAMTTNKDISTLPARLQSRFGDIALSVYVLNSGKDYRRGGINIA